MSFDDEIMVIGVDVTTDLKFHRTGNFSGTEAEKFNGWTAASADEHSNISTALAGCVTANQNDRNLTPIAVRVVGVALVSGIMKRFLAQKRKDLETLREKGRAKTQETINKAATATAYDPKFAEQNREVRDRIDALPTKADQSAIIDQAALNADFGTIGAVAGGTPTFRACSETELASAIDICGRALLPEVAQLADNQDLLASLYNDHETALLTQLGNVVGLSAQSMRTVDLSGDIYKQVYELAFNRPPPAPSTSAADELTAKLGAVRDG